MPTTATPNEMHETGSMNRIAPLEGFLASPRSDGTQIYGNDLISQPPTIQLD